MSNVNLIDNTPSSQGPIDRMSMFNRPDAWLLHLGHLTEVSEQNLILYGYIACPGVMSVECAINAPSYQARYLVILNKRAMLWYKVQRWLNSKRKIWASLMLLLLLKLVGPFNPEIRINRCVKDYAGERWNTYVEVVSARQYANGAVGDRAKGWFLPKGDDDYTEVRR